MSTIGLEDSTWQSTMAGLVRGTYSLMLGAGASVGATNGLGEAVPLAAKLNETLCSRYSIPAPPGTISLREVYDLSERIARRDVLELPATYLSRMFTNCTVPPWYESLVKMPWNIIWNLNVDDVLANAYLSAFSAQAIQELRLVSWNEPAGLHRESASSVTAVHLHGRARDENVIFGSLEYLSAVHRGGAGHQLFWDEWSTRPVIILGASLSDELDMAVPLAQVRADQPDAPPSLVILKSVSEYDRFRLETAGLIVVEATAEDFFHKVRESWSEAAALVASQDLIADPGMNPANVYFLQRFRRMGGRPDRYHDFYAGDDPIYDDVCQGLDAPRSIPGVPGDTDPEYCSTLFPPQQATIATLTGALSGTSTCELRTIRNLETAGMRVYEFDGESAFDAKAVHWAFKRDPNLVLRIQDVDDFPGAMSNLVELASNAGTTVRIVSCASSRDRRRTVLEPA